MSNYPDDIHLYDNHPRSPHYVEPEECLELFPEDDDECEEN